MRKYVDHRKLELIYRVHQMETLLIPLDTFLRLSNNLDKVHARSQGSVVKTTAAKAGK